MKKILAICLLSQIILFGFFSCDNGATNNNNNTPKTIDSRLIGGKWFDGSTGSSSYSQNIYYRFTTNNFITTTSGAVGEVTIAAYTENGQIKSAANDAVLANYIFLQPSAFHDEEQAALAIAGSNQIPLYLVRRKMKAAETGNMVRFTVSGVSIDMARWENVDY